jgi:transcriptional regulator with XRE-family HTH domain
MDFDTRLRLRAQFARANRTAKEVSIKLGFAPTYVSRILNDGIKNPSADSIRRICDEIGADIGFILTGKDTSLDRRELLAKLSAADDDVLAEVVAYAKTLGVNFSK